jgi:inosine-uridine nucleoside N-ribohydrolase
MLAAARRHGRRLTLIALGPLTNVALAIEADAAAVRSVGRVVAMGGAVDVPGNVTPDAEFNMHVDPDAARRVLDAGLPLELVPLDATRQAILERHALDTALGATPPLFAERVRRFTAHSFGAGGGRGMPLHDPLAVGVALDSSLVEWEPVRLAIGPEGQTRRAAGEPNARFARVIDAPRFLTMFTERLWPAS